MLNNLNLDNVLFLDIETVSQSPDFSGLNEKFKYLWEKKAALLMRNKPDATADQLYSSAGIYAEFGKIVCISCGFTNGKSFRLKSYYGDDEKILLEEFATLLLLVYEFSLSFQIQIKYDLFRSTNVYETIRISKLSTTYFVDKKQKLT